MYKKYYVAFAFLLFNAFFTTAQESLIKNNKIKISGIVYEKSNQKPLEYATITLKNTANGKLIGGGITNEKGVFAIEVVPGTYDILIEFLSFKTLTIKQKEINANINLGKIELEENPSQLGEVVVKSTKAAVEIKLDKKIFNVGEDKTNKGGTASDVLANVPSVAVDADGNVSLRGNENVRILIDGKPSVSVNVADALKSIPADALDKVEVITNPSSRYDAEGGAGIINIVLKKGKNNGINATASVTIGDPKNYNISGNFNVKTKSYNVFSGFGYNDSNAPGNSINNTNYLNTDGSLNKTVNELSDRSRNRNGFNGNIGIDTHLDKNITWTNVINYRNSKGSEPEKVVSYNVEENNNFIRNRNTTGVAKGNDFEYASSLVIKTKKEGEKLNFDFSISKSDDDNRDDIADFVVGNEINTAKEFVFNNQTQKRKLFQFDYVLPIGKESQFETGYRGNFNDFVSDFEQNVTTLNLVSKGKFEYIEHINAFYSQFGSKANKLSYMFGLRYEDSNLDINNLSGNVFKPKKYGNLFPSAFLSYQLNDNSTIGLNYSRRINRPRNRFINPFADYSSNVNLFQGNPDIDPALTNAFDFNILKKWSKTTFSSSLYYNVTQDVFQFIRRPNGEMAAVVVNGVTTLTPVVIATPVNLDKENRYGFEMNINYTPYKWWRLNSNVNVFKSELKGSYSYLINTPSPQTIIEMVHTTAFSWFTRLTSRISFPNKIDWQVNANYNAPQNTAQGKSLATYNVNTSLNKDLFNDKASLTLSVSDLFNSNKMIREANLTTINSYLEMQRRVRQINLTFTYRFNKPTNEKEKPTNKKPSNDGGGEMDF
jgi:outer membrane receptor for ferrienterochelin and colicins